MYSLPKQVYILSKLTKKKHSFSNTCVGIGLSSRAESYRIHSDRCNLTEASTACQGGEQQGICGHVLHQCQQAASRGNPVPEPGEHFSEEALDTESQWRAQH